MNRPKRRKSKDNPYTIVISNNKYYVVFYDVNNIKNEIEINKDIFYAFDEFELDDKAQMNKEERHIEKSEVYDETLFKRANYIYESIEDKLIQKSNYENLINAINSLSLVTKRRIKMFYFEELTTNEIASIEHCSQRMIRKSLEQGKLKIKEYFEKNNLI